MTPANFVFIMAVELGCADLSCYGRRAAEVFTTADLADHIGCG
jgi:hypothetical protein